MCGFLKFLKLKAPGCTGSSLTVSFLMLSTVFNLSSFASFIPSSSLSLELLLSVLTFKVCSTVSFSSSFSSSNCFLFCYFLKVDNKSYLPYSNRSHKLFPDSILFHHKVFSLHCHHQCYVAYILNVF